MSLYVTYIRQIQSKIKPNETKPKLLFRFPSLQDSMKAFLSTEMEKVVREEKFLKEEPERLESALRRCKKLTGTLVTLKRYLNSKRAPFAITSLTSVHSVCL